MAPAAGTSGGRGAWEEVRVGGEGGSRAPGRSSRRGRRTLYDSAWRLRGGGSRPGARGAVWATGPGPEVTGPAEAEGREATGGSSVLSGAGGGGAGPRRGESDEARRRHPRVAGKAAEALGPAVKVRFRPVGSELLTSPSRSGTETRARFRRRREGAVRAPSAAVAQG